MDALAAVIASY